MKKIKRIISLLLCAVIVLSLAACGKPADEPVVISDKSADLMEGITASAPVTYGKPSAASLKAAVSFGTRLFEKLHKEDKNTLISPLSILIALSMTANGAEGETLEQMEQLFGLKIDDLNKLLGSLIEALGKDESSVLNVANAIWFKDETDFVADPAFLQKNADIFKASLFKAPFDDSTLKDINNWVNKNTKGMIKDILDRINPDAVMYLVNALAFEAKWENSYTEEMIRKETFHNGNGTENTVDFLKSRESYYIATDNATGFQKYYEGGRYSFIALLPSAGKTTADVLAELSDTVVNLDKVRSNTTVITALPKFTLDYKAELGEALQALGMGKAFSDDAQFDALGKCPESGCGLKISRVIHQTHIEVDSEGTKAGAATVVEMAKATAFDPNEKPTPEVILNRPFVYMLFDDETGMPFFIGVINNL